MHHTELESTGWLSFAALAGGEESALRCNTCIRMYCASNRPKRTEQEKGTDLAATAVLGLGFGVGIRAFRLFRLFGLFGLGLVAGLVTGLKAPKRTCTYMILSTNHTQKTPRAHQQTARTTSRTPWIGKHATQYG